MTLDTESLLDRIAHGATNQDDAEAVRGIIEKANSLPTLIDSVRIEIDSGYRDYALDKYENKQAALAALRWVEENEAEI